MPRGVPFRYPAERQFDVAVNRDPSIDASVHRNWLSRLASQQTFWVSVAAVLAFVVLSFASDVFATQQTCST